MNYLIEAIIIGIYSSLLFIPLNLLIKNIYLIFFLTGFLKHFLGYFIGIHNLYCKFHNLEIKKVKILQLTLESILEGILYLIGGTLLLKLSKTNGLIVFLIGFILHIVFEIIGIHDSFLNNRCYKT